MSKQQQSVFDLKEIVFSEKGNAPTAEDGCDMCQHCLNRRPLDIVGLLKEKKRKNTK